MSETHILLVEDDILNQQMASHILSSKGLTVIIANDGLEAVNLIKRKTFKLILMDIQMPVMDGWAATEQIRALEDPYFKTVPIVAFTASAGAETKQRAEKLGMNGFLSKPYNPEEMYSAIHRYIAYPCIAERREELRLNFDLYHKSDLKFKMELITLMIFNLMELKQALETSNKNNDPVIFRRAVHKVRSTLTLLNDPALELAIEEMRKQVLNNKVCPNKVSYLNESCERIIESLRRETQFLKTG